LWGIDEEPFCPFEKNSSTSKTSVLCKCLISVASRSAEVAISPSTEKKKACLSLGIICVDIGSTVSFNFFATYFSIFGPRCAKVPTAPDIAQVDISFIACSNLFLFLKNSA